MKKYLWEILVPVENINSMLREEFDIKVHQAWDEKVRQVAGGLTIMKTGKGNWIDTNEVCIEKMIPVRIMCTKKQINDIADMTAEHYRQTAVMFYKVSNEVIIKMYD